MLGSLVVGFAQMQGPLCALHQTSLSSCLLYLSQGNRSHKRMLSNSSTGKKIPLQSRRKRHKKDAVVSLTVSTERLSRKY